MHFPMKNEAKLIVEKNLSQKVENIAFIGRGLKISFQYKNFVQA